jgi:hypothetical protein
LGSSLCVHTAETTFGKEETYLFSLEVYWEPSHV